MFFIVNHILWQIIGGCAVSANNYNGSIFFRTNPSVVRHADLPLSYALGG